MFSNCGRIASLKVVFWTVTAESLRSEPLRRALRALADALNWVISFPFPLSINHGKACRDAELAEVRVCPTSHARRVSAVVLFQPTANSEDPENPHL
jgi:hypothetical protein